MPESSRPILLIDCTESPISGTVFEKAIQRCSPPGTPIEVHRVPGDLQPTWPDLARAGRYRSIVISGSAACISDDLPWVARLCADLRDVVGTGIPTLGICFGHQLLAHAFGGTVGSRVIGYKVRGVRELSLMEDSQALQLLQPQPNGPIHALVSHQDQVIDPPPGWHVVGRSDYCAVQALRAADLPVLTVQWHPEADPAFLDDNSVPPWDDVDREQVEHLDGNGVLHRFLSTY